jgi:hypothetical protein
MNATNNLEPPECGYCNRVELLLGRYPVEGDDITVYMPSQWKRSFSISDNK